MAVTPGLDRHRSAAVVVAAAAILLSVQLLVPPVIGLANNADFEKVMGYVGFQYLPDSYQERYFSWVLTKFAIVQPGWYRSGYYTSETLLAGVARLVGEVFTKEGVFDIRVLGALHISLLLLALGGIVSSCRDLAVGTRWLAAFLLVWFFTDVGYAAAFNSLYSQTASFLFLMLTIATAARSIRLGRLEGRRLLTYFLCALLFVCSKPQESIQGPLLALFGLRLAGTRWRDGWRQSGVWMAVALCAFSFVYARSTPRSLRDAALYQVVFYEILPHSPNPEADIEELDLNPQWRRYAGTTAWQQATPLNDPGFREELSRRAGYARVFELYARHPSRLEAVVRRGASVAWSLRPAGYGNFEKKEGLPPAKMTEAFATWSSLRQLLNDHSLVWLGLLFVGNVGAVVATYGRASRAGRFFREGVLLLVLMAAAEFALCVLANGHTDLVRTLYTFEAICDLLLVADAAWILGTLRRRTRSTSVPLPV
jgi:hypothetical protein